MSRNAKQLGSIRTFFIIGIVLTCLLIGSLAYVKNRSESVQDKANQPTSENQSTSNKDDSTKNETDFGDTTKSDTKNTTNGTDKSSELPTTGPESTILLMFIVFVLTVGAVELATIRKSKNTSFDL